MSIHAGFFKRLFAFIVDLTLVIVVTWLLYLFPFNMIINNSIDSDYKNNIKKPYEAISEEYSGTVSYFGTSSDGKLTVLYNLCNSTLAMTQEEFDGYKAICTSNYSIIYNDLSTMLTSADEAYSADTAEDKQFYSIIYRDYTYLVEMNTILTQYNDRDDVFSNAVSDTDYYKYISFSEVEKEGGNISGLEDAFDAALEEAYKNSLEVLVKALKYYDEKNEDIKISSTLAYSSVSSSYASAGGTTSDVPATLTEEDINVFKTFLEEFRGYQNYVLDKTADATTSTIAFSTDDQEVYYNLYYGLYFEEFNLQLAYHSKVYDHSSWAIIYALSMFTLIFSVYTACMRGNTLGRRCVKVKLTDGHEREKLNPVLALLHDVPFRFLYLIVLGLWSLLVAGIAMLVFLVVDVCMIAFTKKHRTLRDMMTGTRVIQVR